MSTVFVIPFKYFDIKKFTKCDKTQNLLFGVQNMERVIKAMKTYSTPENPVNEFVTLYDLDGINFKSMMNKQCKFVNSLPIHSVVLFNSVVCIF